MKPAHPSFDTRPNRPFVLINMAMTADGKIATANRSVTSFGSPRDLHHLYELRATADAILCGARTLEQSHATLGNGGESFRRRRLRKGLAEYPLRVLVSGSGTISPTAEVWAQRFSPIILLATSRAKPHLTALRALADEVWIASGQTLNFHSTLERLYRDRGVRRLLCEGGAELNDALLRAGLVDELHLTICPRLFGGRTAPTIADGEGVPQLARAAQFTLKSRRWVDGELFAVFRRQVDSKPVGQRPQRR
ncbi:MAG: RibD family protein [Verrucomicrobia bacterium]|nr:RibD family protein [Verrucomicrobiota bacterium]